MRVVAPGSTEEAAALLSEAAADKQTVRIRGQGTKADWGVSPPPADLIIETRNLSGIVEHAASDLVVVVRAGMLLRNLQRTLSLSGQQLALDETVPGASVGGTVAANTSGPRRLGYGTVRDLLIGVTIVRPDGVVARAGGKVVKNVAGYDLCKLFTGSVGTLGLITECAFRLHPLPRHRVFVSGRAPTAAAMEVDAPGGEVVSLLERPYEGGREVAPLWWGKYPWEPGGIGVKLTCALSKVDRIIAEAAPPLTIRGSAGTGVLYAGLPATVDPREAVEIVARLRQAAHEAGGFAVVVTAPPLVRQLVDFWGPVPGIDIMRRIKALFDPDARFAPGTFVGGI
jgi:glycolate dehydrogenase FAD-binding subunit